MPIETKDLELVDENVGWYDAEDGARMFFNRTYRYKGHEQIFGFDIPDTPDYLKIEANKYDLEQNALQYFLKEARNSE